MCGKCWDTSLKVLFMGSEISIFVELGFDLLGADVPTSIVNSEHV